MNMKRLDDEYTYIKIIFENTGVIISFRPVSIVLRLPSSVQYWNFNHIYGGGLKP